MHLETRVPYVGRGQKWDRAVNLYDEGQGIQRREIAREGSVWCRCPSEVTKVRRVVQVSGVPKISGNQSWVAIDPWYT